MMNWFDYFLQIVLLVVFVWVLKTFFYLPSNNRTQHSEKNDDSMNKNKVNERARDESSSENDSELSKLIIDTTDNYEDEDCYKSCNNISYKNENQINITNVMECSGYGTTEEEIHNFRLNIMSYETEHDLDICDNSFQTTPQESIPRKNTKSIALNEYDESIGTERDLQNLESTEDEGNESQVESSQEDLKKKTFFSDRKYKNLKRFNLIEIGDFENEPLTEIHFRRSNKDPISSENNFSIDFSESRFKEENYSDFKHNSGSTKSDMLNTDTRSTYSKKNQKVFDSSSSSSFEHSNSLPSSIHGDDSSFRNLLDSQFSYSDESQKVSGSNSSSSSLPSSIYGDDGSFQIMPISYTEGNDESFFNLTASGDDMNKAFIEHDVRRE